MKRPINKNISTSEFYTKMTALKSKSLFFTKPNSHEYYS